MFACQRLSDGEGPGGAWLVSLPGGEQLVWDGYGTGPLALTADELDALSRDLIGVPLSGLRPVAAERLRPHVSDGTPRPSLVLHSATPALRYLESEVADALAGRPAEDGATNVETRAVALARPGDLVVGRTEPWRTAAELARAEPVAVPGIEWYYLSHALIRLAAGGDSSGVLERIADALRARPDTVVRVYVLDAAMQVLLLLLARLAGAEAMTTDANHPEIGDRWNAKTALHPAVEDALAAAPAARTAEGRLAEETELTPLARRLGVGFDRLPGYAVTLDDADEETATARLLAAARMLRERYGLERGCFKPHVGGAGARVVAGLALRDEDALRRLAAEAWARREAYVLEAHVAYLRHRIRDETLLLAPSAHVRHGRVAEGLALQLVRGTSWRGNVYFDAAAAPGVGLELDAYDRIVRTLTTIHAAFARNGLGLVTAGFDFAVGTVGGDFGDRVLVGVQDPNPRFHGAELMRLFLDELHDSDGPRYAATKVVRPAAAQTLPLLRSAERTEPGGRRLRVLSAIPGRWGMIAASGETPAAATGELLDAEEELVRDGRLVAS